MEVGFKIRRLLVVSVRGVYRSVCNHPLLVAVVCFLFLLYRSSPWLFSLLVSASPVLVCTALLLGTLLSFGQPNIPEIEREEGSFSHEIAPLKTGLCENAAIVTRVEDCFSESLSCEKKKEAEESVIDRGISVDGADDAVEKDDGLLKNAWPVENTSRDIQFDRTVLREGVIEKSDMEEEDNISVHDEKIGSEGVSQSHENGENQNRLTEEEVYHTIEVENGKNERKLSDDHLESLSESQWKEIDEGDDDQLEIRSESQWKEVDEVDDDHLKIRSKSQWKEVDEGDDEDDVSMDSGSEHAESSSPDASISDIRPMLDELHPLLDEEELLVADLTHENSDIASEHSGRTKSENMESDEDSKNGEVGNDDDADDLEEEEEAQEGKDDESKTAISWTEVDQKNLMDLGTLELERNQRLENLIARRRARKTMGLMAEKNLIDLDYIDLPFNVPHIATMRQNPFDGTDDSNHNVGLPPIPGSAPSVMLKRRNPFDLPYEPNEEKPDLKGDSFQKEFTSNQQRDAIFRRHESFSVGPSNLEIFRKEKQDMKWRPYFVPEHLSADEPNDHPIQRQLSEVSDSKVSSEPDTESVASLTDQDNKDTNELDSSKEAENGSYLDRDSLRVEHGTESSEDFNSPEVEEAEKDISLPDENVIMLGSAETQDESESSFSEAMNASLDSNTNGSPSTAGTVDEESSSKSSSSFYSEVNESVPDVKKEENSGPTAGVDAKNHFITEHEGEDANFSFPSGTTVDGNQHREPVYDSSPTANERDHLCSSFPSNLHVDMVETGPTPEVVQNSSKTEGESMQKNAPDYDEMFASASLLHAKNGNGSVNQEVTEVMKDGMHEAKPSLVNGEIGNENGPETSIEHASTSSSSPPSWDESIAEGIIHRQGLHDEYGNVHLLSSDAKSFDAARHPLGEHQEGFVSPSPLKESEVSELERLPSNGIEHEPTIEVDVGTKEGVDLVEVVVTEAGEPHPSAPDGLFHESMELKLDNVQHDKHEKSKLHADVPANIDDPLPRGHSDGRDMTTSYQHHVMTEETELSPHNDQQTLGHGSVPVIHPVSLINSESVADHINAEQEDICREHSVYSSDEKEDTGLIQEADLEAVNIPSKMEQSKSEDLQNQGETVIIEESATEGKGADEDYTQETLQSGATSLSDSSTTSPHSVPTSDRTLEFLSPTGTAYYSDDSVRGVRFVTHDRILEYSEHVEEASDSVDDVTVEETSDRSADTELASFAVGRADGTDLPYFPSETGEARSPEDTSEASIWLHGGANVDAKMVSGSSSTNSDHVDLKNQVEEISGFSETRHVEVEETSDGVQKFSRGRDHSNGLSVMEANEMSPSDHVHSTNEVAAYVADTGMIESYDVEKNLSLPVLEARSVEDINVVFEQFREVANMEELILPSSSREKTRKDEPPSSEKTSPNLQVVEPRSLDDVKQTSTDEEDQRSDNMHSEDRLAEDVAGAVNNSAEPSDSSDASFEEAGASVESKSTSSMPVLVATSTGDTGTTNGVSHREAIVEDDVLPPVSSDPSVYKLGRQDGNGSATRDVGFSETVHLPEEHTVEADKEVHTGDASATVQTAQDVAADNTKHVGVEPDPHKSDSSDGLTRDIQR